MCPGNISTARPDVGTDARPRPFKTWACRPSGCAAVFAEKPRLAARGSGCAWCGHVRAGRPLPADVCGVATFARAVARDAAPRSRKPGSLGCTSSSSSRVAASWPCIRAARSSRGTLHPLCVGRSTARSAHMWMASTSSSPLASASSWSRASKSLALARVLRVTRVLRRAPRS